MASGARLSGVTSREFVPGILARPADGAGERAISVGISAALFGLSGFRRMLRGTDLSLPGNQMPVTAQYPYLVATPRTVKLRGLITTFENLSQKSLDKLAKSDGWQ